MKIKRIAHLGIAVKDLDEALRFFTKDLPLQLTHTEDYQGMKIGFLPVGDSSIELLQDVSGSSAIKKFIEKNGEAFITSLLRWTTSQKRWQNSRPKASNSSMKRRGKGPTA